MTRPRLAIRPAVGATALALGALSACDARPGPGTDQPDPRAPSVTSRAAAATDSGSVALPGAGGGAIDRSPDRTPPALDTVTRNPEFDWLDTPNLWAVRVGPDTVWFLGEISEYAPPPASYGFVRATAEWVRRGPRPDLDRGGSHPSYPGPDTVDVAPGIRLVRTGHLNPAGDSLVLSDRSRLSVPADLPLELKKRLVGPLLERISPRPNLDREAPDFPVIRAVSAWLARDSVVWLGRAGAWSEMTGGLGGIVRVDLASRTARSVWTEDLNDATVTGLAFAGERLWVGTMRPGEYGPYAADGVLLYDPQAESWDRVTPASSPLPDRLVWGLSGVGDSVWIATDAGLAVVDARTGTWDVRYFEPTLAGDTVVYALRASPPVSDPVRDVALALTGMLEVERRAAFLEAARRAAPGPFVDTYRTNEGWERPLGDTVFVPFLTDALGRSRAAESLAVAALGYIPVSYWDPAPLLEMLVSRPVYQATRAAESLARAGHPEGLAWLRAKLRDPTAGTDLGPVIGALGELRDTASVPELANQAREQGGRAAVRALVAMRSDRAWRALVEAASEAPGIRSDVLRLVDVDTLDAPLDDPDFRAGLEDLARLTMSGRDESDRRSGAAFLLRRGDRSGVPVILDILANGDEPYFAAVYLVRVTGAVSAPLLHPFDDDPAARERAFQFWTRWWDRNGEAFQPLEHEAGLRALERWKAEGGS